MGSGANQPWRPRKVTATARQTLSVVALLLCLDSAALAVDYPRWLRHGDATTNSASTNDYAIANLGQLRWFATNACDELEAKLPGGAGTGLWTMVWSFSASSNYVAVNMGQVKSVAMPVYDRLIAEGYTNDYPWIGTATDDPNYAAATLGQVKDVFSFDLSVDDDSDNMPDWWENHWFGDTNETAEGDFDKDGFGNLVEYTAITDPTDPDSDDDGTWDGAEGDAGTDPRDASSHPVKIGGEVSYSGYLEGTIHVVAQTISDGWTTDSVGSMSAPGAYSITNVPNLMNYWIKAWRDTDRDGGNDYWEPVGSYAGNPVSLTTNISGIDITLTNPTNDLDVDGLPDWWELRCFGDTNLQAELDDADFDSANNAAEYGIGSDPTDGALYVNETCGNDTNSGVGNITNDPRLVTSSYRLNADSPCIDAGVSNAITAAVAFDIEGNARWDDPGYANATSMWDMGCYEFVDTDADQIADAWEDLYLGRTNAASHSDMDVDGVTNTTKHTGQTISISFDTDGDGLSDYEEANRYGTSPIDPDSDDDGMLDGYEVWYRFNPTNVADTLEDFDGDGVVNGIEAVSGTCPTNPVFRNPLNPDLKQNKIDPLAQRPKERFPGQTMPRQRNTFVMPP